jgi:hypothetical protein
MLTEDRFQQDRPPIFLSDYRDEIGQPDTARGWDLAAISSKILRASVLAVAVTAIGIAVLSIGNPVALVANVTDWLDNKPAVQVEAEPATSATQSVASTQDSPPTATDAPAREEITASVQAAEPRQPEPAPAPAIQAQQAESGQRPAEASQSQAAAGQLMTEELFKQFQAWAAEQETKTQAGSAPAAPVRVAQDTPAQARPAKRHRRVHSVQNARAEIRPQRLHRARVRQQEQEVVQGQAPPVADPRAPDPSMQNAQPPSFLQSLGFRNQ